MIPLTQERPGLTAGSGGGETGSEPSVRQAASHSAVINGVQYLRGYAALSVVVYHMSLQWLAFGHFPVFEALRSGVDVFFVISGFVMVHSTDAGSRLTAVQFMQRRLVRIVPLYWLVTTITLTMIVVAPSLVRTTGTNVWHALGSYAFIPLTNPGAHNRFPVVLLGWTLIYEMFFYVSFALAIWLGKQNSPRVMTILIVSLVAFVVVGRTFPKDSIGGYYSDPIIIEFLLGAVVALTFRMIRSWPDVALCALAAGAIMALLAMPDMSDPYRTLRFGFPAAILLLAAANVGRAEIMVLHRLGDLSYSLYLTHFIAQPMFARVLWVSAGHVLPIGHGYLGYTLFMIIGSLGSVMVGYACWRWIERPLTNGARSALGRVLAG